jgi:hypothetical protein
VLVLHSDTHPLPLYEDTDFTWAFVAGDHAREPARLVKPLITAGFGIGDVVQAGGMLNGIRRAQSVVCRPANQGV